MAVVARPVADAPPDRRAGVIRAVLTAALLFVVVSGEALDVGLDGYREAHRAGALGTVTGRVVAEPRTLNAPGQPFTGATVTLLPRSESLLARLEQLKEGSRESAGAFAGAVPAMRRARDGYERELWEAAAPELAITVPVDAEGGFRLDDVPAGAWMAIAWHSTSEEVSGHRLSTKQRTKYAPQQRVRGLQSVTIWLRTLTVGGAGSTETLDLTDRNAWFRGVIEERALDTGR
jgi:hypothetical protein